MEQVRYIHVRRFHLKTVYCAYTAHVHCTCTFVVCNDNAVCKGSSFCVSLNTNLSTQDLASEKAELKRALKSAQDSIEELKVCMFEHHSHIKHP